MMTDNHSGMQGYNQQSRTGTTSTLRGTQAYHSIGVSGAHGSSSGYNTSGGFAHGPPPLSPDTASFHGGANHYQQVPGPPSVYHGGASVYGSRRGSMHSLVAASGMFVGKPGLLSAWCFFPHEPSIWRPSLILFQIISETVFRKSWKHICCCSAHVI